MQGIEGGCDPNGTAQGCASPRAERPTATTYVRISKSRAQAHRPHQRGGPTAVPYTAFAPLRMWQKTRVFSLHRASYATLCYTENSHVMVAGSRGASPGAPHPLACRSLGGSPPSTANAAGSALLAQGPPPQGMVRNGRAPCFAFAVSSLLTGFCVYATALIVFKPPTPHAPQTCTTPAAEASTRQAGSAG